MLNIILLLICIVPLAIYIKSIKSYKFKTKEIVVIAMFSAMSYILSLIPFVRYPQGGGINMFSMLPLLLVSILYSRKAGVTAGLITGTISLLIGGYIIHPVQVILDYAIPDMALGLSDMFGKDNKKNIMLGSLVAVLLKTIIHFISGVIFFGQFAPKGINPVLYSFIYNFSGHGIEGLLCVGIIYALPITNLKKVASLQ